MAEHGQPLVAAFPAIAVGAVEDRSAVALVDPRDLGKLVLDARGEEEEPRPLLIAVGEGDAESIPFPRGALHGHAPELDAVGHQLALGGGPKIGRRDAVARQVAVKRGRSLVPRLAPVADEDAAAAPAQHQRGA